MPTLDMSRLAFGAVSGGLSFPRILLRTGLTVGRVVLIPITKRLGNRTSTFV